MNNPARLVEAQNAALREEFTNTAARAGWRFLSRMDAAPPLQTGHALVAGFALWSCPDLWALKQIATKANGKSLEIFLFDVDEFGFSSEAEKFMPGVKMPATTPVIAEYNAGVLIKSHEGRAALKWIDKF